MFRFMVFFASVVLVHSIPYAYRDINDWLENEYASKTATTTTTRATTITTTEKTTMTVTMTTITKMTDTRKKIIGSENSTCPTIVLKDVNEFLNALYPFICIFMTIFLSIIGFCIRKWYQSEQGCKFAWFYPKRPSIYQARRQAIQRRENTLDQFIQASTSTTRAIL